MVGVFSSTVHGSISSRQIQVHAEVLLNKWKQYATQSGIKCPDKAQVRPWNALLTILWFSFDRHSNPH